MQQLALLASGKLDTLRNSVIHANVCNRIGVHSVCNVAKADIVIAVNMVRPLPALNFSHSLNSQRSTSRSCSIDRSNIYCTARLFLLASCTVNASRMCCTVQFIWNNSITLYATSQSQLMAAT